MEDKEIIKALECCTSEEGAKCSKCPYNDYCGALDNKMLNDTLDLINRQKAELDKYAQEQHALMIEKDELFDIAEKQKAEIERLTINMNAFGLGMKREKERADRNLDNLKAVLDERANHSEAVEEFEEEIWRRDEALASIIWYNRHKEWLLDLADQLEAADGSYINPIDVSEWHTEKHCIWMLLVGMYGDWGTSIRGGWIEKTKECAEYIRKLCRDDDEEIEEGEDD